MSERNRSPRPGRSTSTPTRSRGRLPRRVYWVRRLLVLGVAALLVLGITRLLTLGGGGGSGGSATVVGSGTFQGTSQDTSQDTSQGTGPSGAPATGPATPATPLTPREPAGTGKGTSRLPQPEGPCDPSDVLVTPTVTRAHVAQPVRIVLEVTSLQSPACSFEVSPASVIVRLLSPERSEPLWTTQDCTRVVPTRTVVARQTRPGRVPVLWNGRASDDSCSDLTDWVLPGPYTAEAIAVGSTRATASQFVLGPAVRPTVTRTPTPTATATPTQKPARKPGY